MAKVEVGCQLKWQGRTVICTSIQTTNETLYARKDSVIMRSEMAGLSNVKVVTQQWDDFAEGDIISISLQRLELTEPGKNIFFIYSYYNVKKEGLSDGSERLETSDREAAHTASTAGGLGNQSGESVGQQSAGQDGRPTDGSGSSGGGGEDHRPEVGKEREYAATNDRVGAAGGA